MANEPKITSYLFKKTSTGIPYIRVKMSDGEDWLYSLGNEPRPSKEELQHSFHLMFSKQWLT